MSRRCEVIKTETSTTFVCLRTGGTRAPRKPAPGVVDLDPRAVRVRQLDALERNRPLDAMEAWERTTLQKQLAAR